MPNKKQWVYSPTATKQQKTAISKQFEPIIEILKKNLQPIPEPQILNHCVEIFSKWRGKFFYIMQKYKAGTFLFLGIPENGSRCLCIMIFLLKRQKKPFWKILCLIFFSLLFSIRIHYFIIINYLNFIKYN